MSVLRRFNERHQITIPASLIREAGLPEGGLYSIAAKDGRIILEPKEVAARELEGKDWKALDALVLRQVKEKQFTEYSGSQDAKSHLKRLRK